MPSKHGSFLIPALELWVVKEKETNRFDRIVQENFSRLAMLLVQRITGGQQSRVVRLPRKMQRTLEREADMLLKVTLPGGAERIIHIEWQSGKGRKMASRMLLYHVLARTVYGLPVTSIVVYMGDKAVSMKKEIRDEDLSFRYTLIDLRDMDPAAFLGSDVPEEVILAVLMGRSRGEEKRLIIREILTKLRSLLRDDENELSRRMVQLEVLGELRDVQQIILEEEKHHMPITYNIERDIRYNQGLEKGMEKGIEKGFQTAHTSFVKNLLQQTDLSDKKIAALAQVSLEFVTTVRRSLSGD